MKKIKKVSKDRAAIIAKIQQISEKFSSDVATVMKKHNDHIKEILHAVDEVEIQNIRDHIKKMK